MTLRVQALQSTPPNGRSGRLLVLAMVLIFTGRSLGTPGKSFLQFPQIAFDGLRFLY